MRFARNDFDVHERQQFPPIRRFDKLQWPPWRASQCEELQPGNLNEPNISKFIKYWCRLKIVNLIVKHRNRMGETHQTSHINHNKTMKKTHQYNFGMARRTLKGNWYQILTYFLYILDADDDDDDDDGKLKESRGWREDHEGNVYVFVYLNSWHYPSSSFI